MRKHTFHLLLLFTLYLPFSALQAKLTLPGVLQEKFSGADLVYDAFELKAPPIAENGATVNVSISKVRLPGQGVYVKQIELYKAYNPEKPVYVFRLGKTAIAEGLRTRIKLTRTTYLYAFARLSNGQTLVTSTEVKVTIGGCGGGGTVSGSYPSRGSWSAPGRTSTRSHTGPRAKTGGHYSPGQNLQAGILTAGDIDDNLNFGPFIHYLERMQRRHRMQNLPKPDLRNRIRIRVQDIYGQGVSNAELMIRPEYGHRQFRAFTATNGVLEFFPNILGWQQGNRYEVLVKAPGGAYQDLVAPLDVIQLGADRLFNITLKSTRASLPDALDVMLVIDTTGSMSDELNYLTREFKSIVAAVRARHPGISMRFGLVVYRDHGDAYVVRDFDFTQSVEQIQQSLQQQHASGGGDMPEAMELAMESGLNASWRQGNTARLMFLVADAPPHRQNLQRAYHIAHVAREKGVRIYPLAASGVNDIAEYLMRMAATITQGRYLFLTDDSGVGNKHAEPKVPCYVVTRLDQLMIRVVSSELSGKRVEPQQGQIRRSVGSYSNGVCV